MATLGQLDPAKELLTFVQSSEALTSKLAQEIIDSHLAFYGMLLAIFTLFLILFAGVASTIKSSSTLTAQDANKLRSASYKWSFFTAMLCAWPAYKLLQAFFFPRVIIIERLAEMVGMK
jgi:hypothetical protein